LTKKQRQILLWMPLVGLWALLLVISRNPEGGRDWPSFFMMGILGSLVYVGLWSALIKITCPKPQPSRGVDETLAEGKTRASLIYGDDADDEGREPEKPAQ